MSKRWLYWLGPILFCALTLRLWAGGSGLNVVVVVNQHSTNSVQLGNYYREQRQIPPQNFLRINWTGGNISWALSDFNTYLYNPLVSMLASRQLTNQVDYVVLSMDIPFQLNDGVSQNPESTTSVLFYGPKPDPSSQPTLAPGSTSLYAGSEGIFRSTPPINASSNSFLVTMLTASNLPMARLTVDMGVASDATFPTQTVYLVKSTDPLRNVRYQTFDNALFNTRLRGNYSVQRINGHGVGVVGYLLGAQTGDYGFGVSGVSFAPGALADNLTSYGGLLFSDTQGQFSILSFLAAGASGTYGTVSEPQNILGKFPSPQNYFYQARGFSLAECYYQSVTNPYQGLLLGEPLAAPFAQPPAGSWLNLPAGALLAGTTNLSCQFTASDTNHPVQQVDLFLDGQWLQTLTNIAPAANNALYVKLNGYTTNYTVPSGATLRSVASNLTARLNAEASKTKVSAYAHGDRIELQSTDATKAGAQVSLSVSNASGSATADTTFIRASGTNFLDPTAYGLHHLTVGPSLAYPPPAGNWLLLTITKTNGTVLKLGATNDATLTGIPLLVSNLVNLVNANAQLAGPDGCAAQDFIDYSPYGSPTAEFNLVARTIGASPAKITAALTSSSSTYFRITPTGTSALQDNLGDLQPRAHLYLTAGTTNLPLTVALNTTKLANGYHELAAVAYEGSHVRTQKRITQTVRVQNGSLSATFTTPYASSNVAVEASLPFTVVANTNTVTKIELFSTGGSLTNVTGQASATVSIPGTNLDLGLHPFYAIVSTSSGQQYRTDTKCIRLVGPDAPFPVSITSPPPTLSWPATAGRSYDILATTNLTTTFQTRATVVATNTPAYWTDTNGAHSFYRVRTSQ